MAGDDDRKLIGELRAAFGARCEPERLYDPEHVRSGESEELESFRSLDWLTLTCEHLDRNYSAIHHFPPEAFRYFLPRILAVGVREGRTDLLAYDAIMGMLDRSPRADYWNGDFSARWSGLSAEEYQAVQSWVLWLQERDGDGYHENSFDRAFDTLTLLEQHADGPRPRAFGAGGKDDSDG